MSTTPAPKRRWLTFSLRTFLSVTLALSLVLGYFGRVWWKAYRDSQPPTLYELAQIAKRHGIPMPPKDAKLVLVRLESPFDGPYPSYVPAFLLQEREHGDVVVLIGCDEIELSADSDKTIPVWREFSLEQSQASRLGYVVVCSDSDALLCAVQLAERRDYEQALAIIQRIAEDPFAYDSLPVSGAGPLPDLREQVRQMAYLRLDERLQKQPEQWPELRTTLAGLLEESPLLRRDKAQLLQDLSAAIDAPAPPPNSVEDLLLDCSRSDQRLWGHPGSQEIRNRGFDAVPDLIRLRSDRRITVHASYGDPLDASRVFRRVGDLADELLREISGFQRGEVLSVEMPDQLAELDAAAWQKWWQQAQQQGEREYCVRNFFQAQRDQGSARRGAAQILAHKYPETLLHIGERYLELTDAPVSRAEMAAAIVGLHVPIPTKVEILTNLSHLGSHLDKRIVLRRLAQLDPRRSAELLTRLLDELSAEATGFDSPNSNYAFPNLVLSFDDLPLTQTYLRAARRNVNLRMELVSRLVYWYSSENRRPFRLALLSAFLDDDTLRDRSLPSERSFDDDFAGITVRDFVAMHLAKLLELEVSPNKDWTSEQWFALRDQVRERLQQEKLPALE